MEEAEIPLEGLHEDMHHHAHGGGAKELWITGVALTAALLAALAAVTGMLSGHHANEAMLEQIQASDTWAQFQSKGIKAMVLGSKLDMLKAMGKEVSEKEAEKLKEYSKDKDELTKDAKEKEESSSIHLEHHKVFAYGITMFQVAIAIAAIAALTKRKPFWFVGLAFGCAGVFFLIKGLTM